MGTEEAVGKGKAGMVSEQEQNGDESRGEITVKLMEHFGASVLNKLR
jgi:hypothetical protein